MNTRILLVLVFGVLTIFFNSGCAPLNHSHAGLTSSESAPSSGEAGSGTPIYADAWSGVAAGAATGYCLAKHPYQSNTPDLYTADGYEKVGSPGIVGAIRRNYIYERPPHTGLAPDPGNSQNCEQACRQLGKSYGPSLQGRVLRQQTSNGTLITSGIGDMASLAKTDHDFYTGKTTVAGILSRASTFHESDVAQADYCCCQVTSDEVP